ncbi:hypothetical protein FKM82_017045 [Ascaphus truei]
MEDELLGGVGPMGRTARLMDYLDQEEAASKQAFYTKLQELKIRNSCYLQELNARYQAHCEGPSRSDKEQKLEELFGTNHIPNETHEFPNRSQKSNLHHVVSWSRLISETSDRIVPNAQERPKTANTDPSFSITVPRPFQMTLREAERRDKLPKTPVFSDPVDLQSQEDTECLKQFRAQPVPAHVFLPLYKELVEENETRRKMDVQKRRDFLLSTQEPFSFIAKEEERRKETRQRSLTAPPGKEHSRKQKIPKSVLDPIFSEKLKEVELYRIITRQMRAKDLMQNSAAPIDLRKGKRDPHSSISLKTQEKQLGFLQQNLTFQPRTNPTVPDFDRLYRSFQKESLSNQQVKEPTRNKPFTLRTSNLRGRKRQSHTERGEDSPHAPEAAGRSSSLMGLSCLSPNTLPVYITDSTKRRESAIRFSLEEKEKQESERGQWLEKNKKKTRVMQKSVFRRAKALDPHQSLADTNTEKLKQNWFVQNSTF